MKTLDLTPEAVARDLLVAYIQAGKYSATAIRHDSRDDEQIVKGLAALYHSLVKELKSEVK